MASRPTPMALAKQKYGASVWRGMSAAEKTAAIHAHQRESRALRSPARRSPARTSSVRVRSPLAKTARSPTRPGGAAVEGSLSDMSALIGTLQATNALNDGQAAQLAALQEALISSISVAETQIAQTQAQLERFSVEKAKLIAEREDAVAAKLAAEVETRELRDKLSSARSGSGPAAEPEETRGKLEQALATLAQCQSNERRQQQQMGLMQREAEDAKRQSDTLQVQLEESEAAAQQLREELGTVKYENEQMRLNFSSAEKAKLIAEREDAVAAKLAAEVETRELRDKLSSARSGSGPAAEPEETRGKLEQALATLAQCQSNERRQQQQMGLMQREAEDAKRQSDTLQVQLEESEAAAQQLREELGTVKYENEQMRLSFAARLDDMARGQDRLRAQQDSLSKLAREG